MSEIESAIRETRAIAERRRLLRASVRDALKRGDTAAVVRLAAELVGSDDAESDRAPARLDSAAG